MKPRTSDLKDLFGWVSSSGLTITLRTISSSTSPRRKRNKDECFLFWLWRCTSKVAWPSGLRRWFKAPVSSGAWVRIPPLPDILPINFVQVPNSSTYFIEKWPFLEGSCQNFWHWEGKYAGCWGCGGEMYEQWKKFQGTHGFEPWTYRTAADCSTTELYPHVVTKCSEEKGR